MNPDYSPPDLDDIMKRDPSFSSLYAEWVDRHEGGVRIIRGTPLGSDTHDGYAVGQLVYISGLSSMGVILGFYRHECYPYTPYGNIDDLEYIHHPDGYVVRADILVSGNVIRHPMYDIEACRGARG